MMPNVLRRVLETFLAFKVPRDGSSQDKLKTLAGRFENLDKVQLAALDRLCQHESHSNSVDGLIEQSTMTIEESGKANAAVIHLINEVDSTHLSDMREHCKL
jgi:wobble nucleotide-excising tRNase